MKITESKLRQIISRVIQETQQQVLSPQFRRWFGDSVAVDLIGNPIKLYHGSGDVFDSFKSSGYGKYGPGIYLTAVQDMASRYAMARRSDSLELRPSVYVVYARLINPLIISERDDGSSIISTLSGKLTRAHEALQSEVETVQDAVAIFSSPDFAARVKAMGHDGVLADASGALADPAVAAAMAEQGISKEQMRMMEVVIYDPRNIKSAIGNTGKFNPEDQGNINED